MMKTELPQLIWLVPSYRARLMPDQESQSMYGLSSQRTAENIEDPVLIALRVRSSSFLSDNSYA